MPLWWIRLKVQRVNLICLGQNWRGCLVLSLVKYLIMISLVLIGTALDILTYIGLSSPSTSNSHTPKDEIVFLPLANRSEKKEIKSTQLRQIYVQIKMWQLRDWFHIYGHIDRLAPHKFKVLNFFIDLLLHTTHEFLCK